MPRLMDMGLERLSNMLLDMAAISEKAVETAIESYVKGRDMREEVFQLSEELRWYQDEVAELAVELIARYQPVATDLRYIRSCMEIAYGFSRFGRYAYDITQVLGMFGNLEECDTTLVKQVGEKVKAMIKVSVQAFKERNVELARSLKKMDDEVDYAYVQHVKRALSNPLSSKRCDMATTLILRYLERIADHATYVGDSVDYIVTGERTPRK
ncbi:MAG: phosphate uptake regulator PhoU [Aigarchaeota archaeon]|nr:phosphate uptake regulator PhoU [Candidatus Pelearchaeum maunauluense]